MRNLLFAGVLAVLFVLSVAVLPSSGANEKTFMLKTSSFGSLKSHETEKFENDKTADFSVYSGTTMTTGNTRNLSITYDEVWETLDRRFLSASDFKRLKDQLNKTRIYWNDNKLQAVMVERYFVRSGKHQVTDIFDREYVLANAF